MSLTCGHMSSHVATCELMWVTCGTHNIRMCFAGPHMCLTCEKCSSHVGKRVKLKQHMWATCEHKWATCGPHVGNMRIQCDFSVGAGRITSGRVRNQEDRVKRMTVKRVVSTFPGSTRPNSTPAGTKYKTKVQK